MADIKKLLGTRIRNLRKKKHLTQEQFAEMIDIDQRSLSAIECGINFPTKHFTKIAKVFNIEIKDLFDFNHHELTQKTMLEETQKLMENLSFHDLQIVYKLIKSMTL